MTDKWLIVGGIHFGAAAIILKFLEFILPTITWYYSFIANFLLYLYFASFTFELTKRWHLNERIQPENRAVFITGCDSGFGHNLAKRLDSLGYSVFAGCLYESGIGAKELKQRCSKRLQIIEVDVTKDDSVNNAVSYIKNNLGTSELWAIVNNAGILKGFEVELTAMESFRDVMEVNAFGLVRVTKAFLPLLRQTRGRVVNLTSLGGRLAIPYCTPYTMSKYAAVGFSECLKQELDVWGIRVVSIEPEFFKTGLSDPEDIKRKIDMCAAEIKAEIAEDYGEKYLQKIRHFSDHVTGFCSENIDVVIDALDDAISLKYPNSVYKPCRNFLFQVFFTWLNEYQQLFSMWFLNLFVLRRDFQSPEKLKTSHNFKFTEKKYLSFSEIFYNF